MNGNYMVDLVFGEVEYAYRDSPNIGQRHLNSWFKNNGCGLNYMGSTYHSLLLLGVF